MDETQVTIPDIYVIVGLGNPGRDYRNTRHNVGFQLLDRLVKRLNARFSRLQSRALVANSQVDRHKLVLAKPQTFMNLSGQSVQGLIHSYKIPLEHLLIVHDDLDLPVGTIRLRPDGGAAGQKGMQSIIQRLGTNVFPRLRIGIDHPGAHLQPQEYVLQDFTPGELQLIEPTLERAEQAALAWVLDGLEAAMTRYNAALPSE